MAKRGRPPKKAPGGKRGNRAASVVSSSDDDTAVVSSSDSEDVVREAVRRPKQPKAPAAGKKAPSPPAASKASPAKKTTTPAPKPAKAAPKAPEPAPPKKAPSTQPAPKAAPAPKKGSKAATAAAEAEKKAAAAAATQRKNFMSLFAAAPTTSGVVAASQRTRMTDTSTSTMAMKVSQAAAAGGGYDPAASLRDFGTPLDVPPMPSLPHAINLRMLDDGSDDDDSTRRRAYTASCDALRCYTAHSAASSWPGVRQAGPSAASVPADDHDDATTLPANSVASQEGFFLAKVAHGDADMAALVQEAWAATNPPEFASHPVPSGDDLVAEAVSYAATVAAIVQDASRARLPWPAKYPSPDFTGSNTQSAILALHNWIATWGNRSEASPTHHSDGSSSSDSGAATGDSDDDDMAVAAAFNGVSPSGRSSGVSPSGRSGGGSPTSTSPYEGMSGFVYHGGERVSVRVLQREHEERLRTVEANRNVRGYFVGGVGENGFGRQPSARTNIVVLSGPSGVGKTCVVERLALLAQVNVVEVHPGVHRTPANIEKLFREVTQARGLALQRQQGADVLNRLHQQLMELKRIQRIAPPKPAATASATVDGAKKDEGKKDAASKAKKAARGALAAKKSVQTGVTKATLQNFFAKRDPKPKPAEPAPPAENVSDSDDDVKAVDNSTAAVQPTPAAAASSSVVAEPATKARGADAIVIDESPQGGIVLAASPPSVISIGASISSPTTAAPPAAAAPSVPLLHLESGDVVFDDEGGFHSAVRSMVTESKCPVIVTAEQQLTEQQLLQYGEGVPQFRMADPMLFHLCLQLTIIIRAERPQLPARAADVAAFIRNTGRPVRDVRGMLWQAQLATALKPSVATTRPWYDAWYGLEIPPHERPGQLGTAASPPRWVFGQTAPPLNPTPADVTRATLLAAYWSLGVQAHDAAHRREHEALSALDPDCTFDEGEAEELQALDYKFDRDAWRFIDARNDAETVMEDERPVYNASLPAEAQDELRTTYVAVPPATRNALQRDIEATARKHRLRVGNFKALATAPQRDLAEYRYLVVDVPRAGHKLVGST